MKYIKLSTVLLLTIFVSVISAQAAAYRFDATATQQRYSYIAGVNIDIAALTGDKDINITRAQVQPANNKNRVLPSQVVKLEDEYKILWRVPSAYKSKAKRGSRQKFIITLVPGSNRKSGHSFVGKQANLIYNSGFEKLNSKKIPKGVGISNKRFKKGFRLEQEDSNNYLSFNTKKGRDATYLSPYITIKPGQNYICSFSYRVKDAKPNNRWDLSFTSLLYFTDADGKKLPYTKALYTKKTDTNGWQKYQMTIAAPKDAAQVRWYLRNRSSVPYSVDIDDLRIAPANLPQVTKLETSTGKDLNLRARSPDIRRFDLGPKGSPVWSDYTALSPNDKYNSKRGYGFTLLSGAVIAKNRVRPNALTCDFVSAHRVRLRVDIPNGKYKVYIIAGDSQVGNTRNELYFDKTFSLNGKRVFHDDTSPVEFFKKDFYKHYDDFWTPGMDYYKTFVAPHFHTHNFSTTVTKGYMDIRWRNLPVNALIIAPKSQAKDVLKEISQLKKQRRRATKVVHVPRDTQPKPNITSKDESRGFVLFKRPANIKIYPTSRPKKSERIDSLQTFAAPGQYESAHFSLYPTKDLGDTQIEVASFSNKNGQKISSSDIDLRVVRYIYEPAGYVKRRLSASYKYKITPFVLDHHKTVPVTKGTTWSWWVTVHVPKSTPAGVYTGNILIKPTNKPSYKLPVRVRVLPFKLKPLGIAQGYYYFPGEPWYSTFWQANVSGPRYHNNKKIRKIIKGNLENNLTFMKKIGLTSIAFVGDLRGHGGVTYSSDKGVHLERHKKVKNRFVLFMDAYSKAGMGPMPFYGFQPWGMKNSIRRHLPKDAQKQFTKKWDEGYRSFVRNTNKLGKEKGWPEIIWYVSDEAGNRGIKNVKKARRLGDLLKGMKGVTTIASMNHPVGDLLPGHVDIAMPNRAYPITKKSIKHILDSGSKLWIYNCGAQRLTLGLYPWRINAGGRFQWFYSYGYGDPWDNLDSTTPDSRYNICIQGPNGPVGTLRSEWLRAGINDHRYANTLQAAIKKAKDNPDKKQIVKKAEKFIERLHKRVPIDIRKFSKEKKINAKEAGGKLSGNLNSSEALNRVRWAMAELIVELKK